MTIWLITGASTGLGRALTEIVLENGDTAIATARRPETLSDLIAKYPASRLLTLKLDVSRPQEIVDVFNAAKEKFGRIDVVANNAGRGAFGEVEAIDDADARDVMEINFWAAANVSREAVKFFREVNPAGVGGRLLQVGSAGGLQGFGAMAYYSASKFALEGFSEGLASEIDPAWNIKITIIEPGGFDTPGIGKTAWAPAHPAYSKKELPGNFFRSILKELRPQGDPRKGMEVVYKLATLEDPPLHFPLGKDAVDLVRKKTATLLADTEKYESWNEGLEKSA
ncbi:NAD(P)-binding protein [Dichomitus squalens]|uniref:NAD(P)-binding protein n=2 Tax=Dichomitus squalens TaxID=114155 RepID=A0A4V2K9L9_9APHY|nr:NAD(P)-binding protein [Dichomitus squalens LYAD-421 SS1]EJF55823.1 NAD(P)-binding protein [Dichomitus squalens LYAD-421 SS1]TBU31649.1 NAD(P)-binding protein [Dichomitus squalens]TBU48106.1 NAD(P)-binding protein [Dichomitus squalens]TBU64388.1 NAD(P)-binding protein [Dichomitus squalens]